MMIAPPSPPKFAFLSLMTSTARIVVAVGGYYAPVRLIDGHNACGPYTHPPSLIATLHPATGTTTVYTYKKEADVCLFRSKCKCESTTSTAFKKICITEKNTVNRVKKKKKRQQLQRQLHYWRNQQEASTTARGTMISTVRHKNYYSSTNRARALHQNLKGHTQINIWGICRTRGPIPPPPPRTI